MNITIVYLILYFIILSVITVTSSRRQTNEEYINSAKGLTSRESTWTTFASLLTGYNFVIGVTFSFLYGFWYLMAFIGGGMAFVVLYWFYKKNLSVLQKENNFLSVGDYFGAKYGLFSKNITNYILIGGLFLFLILQMFVNTNLFSALLDINKYYALFITVGVVSIYLWFGGFKASVKTDIFQGILILPIILTVFIFPSSFSVDKIASALDMSQFWFAIGLGLLQFLSLLGQAESFQRVFASKDTASLKRGLVYAFSLLALVGGAVAYLGINFRFAGSTLDPNSLFTVGVLSNLPAWLGPLLIVSLIAAFMGTIDSSAFALGSMISRIKEKGNGEKMVRNTRIFMLAGIILSALSSLYLISFLTSVFALISLISVIGCALLLSFMFKMKELEMNLFLIIGTSVFVLGLVFDFVTDNPLTALIPSGIGILFVIVYRIVKLIK